MNTGRHLLRDQVPGRLDDGGTRVVHNARDTPVDRLAGVKVLRAEKVRKADRKRPLVQPA